MNVKQIVVDELPRDCSLCRLSRGSSISGKAGFCTSMYRPIKNVRKIPEWCPLEVEEVCEWKLTHDNDPNITYKSNHYIDLAIPTHVKKYVNHCPNCGKRIKFESEE